MFATSLQVWSRELSSGFRRRDGVVQWSKSSAQTRSFSDRPVYEVQTICDRRLERPTERKARSDCGGEGASRSMNRFRIDPGVGEVPDSIGSDQHVGDLVARKMASLDQGGAGAKS